MGYVLKSDLTVSDPTGKFPYLTKYGLASKELRDYMAALTAASYDLTQAEFLALRTFIDTLKSLGVWTNVREVYPFIGNSFGCMALKLKAELSAGDLAAVNGLSLTQFEIDGDGKYLGFKARNYVNIDAPAFDLGFTAAALANSWGAVVYADGTGLAGLTGGLADARAFMGSVLNSGNTRAYLFAMGDTAGDVFQLQGSNASGRTDQNLPGAPAGVLRMSAQGNAVTLWDNATEYSGTVTYDAAVDKARNLWLPGKNPYPGAGGITQAFNGKLRFAAIDDGAIPIATAGAYTTAIDTLMTGLGKHF